MSWKMGPALAAGNTVVIKHAELTPLSTLRIAKLMEKVGIPPGVVNIVPGYGNTAGQYLAEHQDINKISFTGSTITGRKIVRASAGNLKRCSWSWAARAPILFSMTRHSCRGRRFRLRHFPQSGPGLYRRLAPDPSRKDRRRISREISRPSRDRSEWAIRSIPKPRWVRSLPRAITSAS